jgi:pyruvate carboxylase
MIETGEREVFFQVNGQLRSMKVKDKAAIKDQKVHPKVDKSKINQIGKTILHLNRDIILIFLCFQVHQCLDKY